MTAPPSQRLEDSPADPWLLLRTLSLFRLLASCLFVAAPVLLDGDDLLSRGGAHFERIAALYLVAAAALALLRWRRQPGLGAQVALQVCTDIVFVTLLLREAGGVESGIGILLCASVSASALLRSMAMSYLFAALAAAAVLGLTHYQELLGEAHSYPQALALCCTYFLVAVLSAHVSRQRLASLALISQQRRRLADLQSLSAQILRQFEHGLLVVDAAGAIAMLNPRAAQLLQRGAPARGEALASASPALAAALAGARRETTLNIDGAALYVQIKALPDGMRLLTLIAEEAREAEAQTRKLAALGQWTASVAHEIRNPLSAITQAAELLGEQAAEPLQARLVAVVARNSARIDTVVSDILNLARPPRALDEWDLLAWLERNREDFAALVPAPHRLEIDGELGVAVAIDPQRLRHVVDNLLANAVAHGQRAALALQLRAGRDPQGQPELLVSDDGTGVPEALRERLFEPFASGRRGGTGLGLFIARELAAQQGIALQLLPGAGGARFALRFPAPQRAALAA